MDRVAKGLAITPAAMRLAARKYYESTISKYFDSINKFALEPFDNKLDRQNQKKLLEHIVDELSNLRRKISTGTLGGTYFADLSNPPVSHFLVSSSAVGIFDALEANFLVSRYKSIRDKDGNPATVFAVYYGLTELERIAWGYPPGRQFRNYFVQRCFDLTSTIHSYISGQKTIRCGNCKTSFPMENESSFVMYKWRCPECAEGRCEIVNLADDFSEEVARIAKDILLEPVELEILNTLKEEGRKMAAGEISSLIDVTYQLVGRRTAKLQDKGLVRKSRKQEAGQRVKSEILERAQDIYFSDK
jgi:DNA-binding MarR family transcriptional regulator